MLCLVLFILMIPLPQGSTLFPYTTLFRSLHRARVVPRMIGCQPVGANSLEASLEAGAVERSEEHTSELQSHSDLVCRLLLEKKKMECRNRYDRKTSLQ